MPTRAPSHAPSSPSCGPSSDAAESARCWTPAGLARALYSSDASLYRVAPQAVARPRTVDELETVLDAARTAGLPVTTRGAGTSCAGNAVGPGWSSTSPGT